MKNLVFTFSVIACVSMLGMDAQAARPCKTIVEACLSAGVIQSGATRQVMLDNCVKPVVAGRGIAGVNVDSSVIQACKAKIASQ
jgi:hypothetical protein